ncbi:MAG: hypothetical protein Q9226_003000 [Calogaya cf. arnoldii]
MERATPSPDADDVAVQFERDWIASPAHHGPVLDNASGDDDPLDLTLALKGPVPTEEEAEVASFVNSVAISTENHKQAKRKRSGSTDSATPELAKRPRTQDAHSRDKLHRPGSQLVKKSAAPVNRADIFAVPDQDEDNHLPVQPLKVPGKRGRPPKNKESSTTLADLRQSSVLNKPDIAATSTAPPPPARRKKATPPQQPERPQTRSRKPLLATSSGVSPRPIKQPEVAQPPSADQAGIVQESQLSKGGEVIANGLPTGKTKRGTPGKPGPKIPQQGLDENDSVSKERTGAQTSTQQLEDLGNDANVEKVREHGDKTDDNEEDHPTSNEQENSGQESSEQESEDQDGHGSEVASDVPELNLFGQDDIWSQITEAILVIGVCSPPKGRGKRIVKTIKAAQQAYNSTDQNDSNVRPQQALEKLTRCIDDLSEDFCSDKGSRVIHDVYAHAIPEMVSLLNKAFEKLFNSKEH